MLLAYTHCYGPREDRPELCLIPDKLDQISTAVRVDSLTETDCAVYRLGPLEAFKVWTDEQDGGTVIKALEPASIYLTPNLPDRPGVKVRQLKVLKDGEGRYRTFFYPDRDTDLDWREWTPNTAV